MMEQLTEEAIQETEEQEELQKKIRNLRISIHAESTSACVASPPQMQPLRVQVNHSVNSEWNLPRPILKVEGIQLLNANIPECTQNIPDTACVFWYYRLELLLWSSSQSTEPVYGEVIAVVLQTRVWIVSSR